VQADRKRRGQKAYTEHLEVVSERFQALIVSVEEALAYFAQHPEEVKHLRACMSNPWQRLLPLHSVQNII